MAKEAKKQALIAELGEKGYNTKVTADKAVA
jgi:hypothetical protein